MILHNERSHMLSTKGIALMFDWKTFRSTLTWNYLFLWTRSSGMLFGFWTKMFVSLAANEVREVYIDAFCVGVFAC